MQTTIAEKIATTKPIVKNDAVAQVKTDKPESFRDRFLAFGNQFPIDKSRPGPDTPADPQEPDTAVPLFSNQIINLIKNNNTGCQQQKNKRRQKQR